MASTVGELVNPVPVDEVAGWSRAMAASFLQDPDGPQSARRVDVLTRMWDPARAWGVRDRDRWVATLRSEQRPLTVPGAAGATIDLAVDRGDAPPAGPDAPDARRIAARGS